jgi:hypothetical protein
MNANALVRGGLATVLIAATTLGVALAVNTASAGASLNAREGVNPFTGEKLATEGCVTTPATVVDPRWNMTVTDGSIRLTQTADGTVLNLGTANVQRGSTLTDLTVIHSTVAAAGATVTTARVGLVEAAQSIPEGVEQAWCFPKAPDGSGDLVVRVAAAATIGSETDDATATTTADGIVLQAPGGITTTYGNGTWLDAAGHATPIGASFVSGAIQLTVPAALLAATAFPAVLDPIVIVTPIITS